VPFRTTFDCLWCGTSHACRGPDDIEGWASLCPDCVGRAGDNAFLRYRLRRALSERAAAGTQAAGSSVDREMLAYYEARAPEYDDWYLRRGRYSHGPEEDAAWAAELEASRRWLEALPLSRSIVEIAAGTGWWSTTLARKGSLRLIDGAAAPLAIARERLAREGLTAESSVRDAWDDPDAQVDALFAGFWLSHVPEARLAAFLGLARRWLRPGGTFAFIDSLPDATSGARDHPAPGEGVAVRRLADGREFRIVKEFRSPEAYAAALERAGFVGVETGATGRFFVLGRGTAAPD
jgi:SAM-dependent methyltransferase